MERKDNTFTMFKNNKFKDTQPDWRGEGMFHGQKISLALWCKIAQSGTEYFSGKFSEIVEADVARGRKPDAQPQLDITSGMVKPDLSTKPTEEPFIAYEIPF